MERRTPTLPRSLLDSDQFKTLGELQKRRFFDRLSYYEEVAEKAIAIQQSIRVDIKQQFEDIELDVFSIITAFSDSEKDVTSFFIKTSWTSDCDYELSPVSFEVKNLLLDDNCGDIGVWVRSWGESLLETLKRLTHAQSYADAISQLIVMDALLAKFLVYSALVRLQA